MDAAEISWMQMETESAIAQEPTAATLTPIGTESATIMPRDMEEVLAAEEIDE